MIQRGAKYTWRFDPPDRALAEKIREATGLSTVMASVLVSRGVTSAEGAAAHVRADLETLPDVHLLPDADRVVERVGRALEHGEAITVHGHDDADGVTAATIMIEALTQLGASVSSYVPDRRTEGHGLNRAELDGLAARGVTLVVTVDSCVSDRDAIRYGNGLGIDTIVTDHHEIPPELPPAAAIVNAKLPETDYPYRYLAGVGVSYRVSELLLAELAGAHGAATSSRPWYGARWRDEALALAAIGSIADKVPMTFDNRVIVTAGLAAMPRTERPGLRALLEETRLWGREVDENDVRDSIGPAFGRVSDGKGGNTALALLLSLDIETARGTARELVDGRGAWRSMAQAAWRQVRAGRPKASHAPVEIVESSVRIEVLGYVTSRLSEELRKPVIVLSNLNGDRMGEARGPGGFNLVDAFNSMAELFLGYGGHPRAAGFTIRNENVPAFRERMIEYAAEHPPEPRPRAIDAELPLVGATSEVGREFDSLAPFGQGNPRPVLVARGTGAEQYEAALAAGLRFSTPVRLGRTPVDLVYRLRYEGARAFASVLDAIATGGSGRAGGTATDGRE